MKSVSAKGITYTDELKHIFITENETGKFPRQIFEACEFDIDIIGMHRVTSSGNRWRATYKNEGVLVGYATHELETLGDPVKENLH